MNGLAKREDMPAEPMGAPVSDVAQGMPDEERQRVIEMVMQLVQSDPTLRDELLSVLGAI